MRAISVAGIAGLFLALSVASADAQSLLFRPALDAIGNAGPLASESPQVPDDVGFGPAQPAPSPRGRVIVEPGTAAPVGFPGRHRRSLFVQP
jgi:hypothetical protein